MSAPEERWPVHPGTEPETTGARTVDSEGR